MQFQSDMLGIPVVRPANTETTAAGAAYFAGLAIGFWKSLEEIGEMWQRERIFEPRMPASEREELAANWTRAVERAKNWVAQS
jgi:glycerol kinase